MENEIRITGAGAATPIVPATVCAKCGAVNVAVRHIGLGFLVCDRCVAETPARPILQDLQGITLRVWS